MTSGVGAVPLVPVVQAFSAADSSWSQMGLAAGNISLKRKAPREFDAHAGVGILNQVVATQRRKESHNATEQKRRQRINEKMKELQLLLPGSDPNADKATVLNTAIDYIKRLQSETEQLTAKKQQLELANQVSKPTARSFAGEQGGCCASFCPWPRLHLTCHFLTGAPRGERTDFSGSSSAA